MKKRQEIRRIAASIMAAVMMVTAVPFGGTVYGNEVPREWSVENTETLTASDSNGEYKKISDSDAEKPTVSETVPEEQIALFAADDIEGNGSEDNPFIIDSADDWVTVMKTVYGSYGRYNQAGNLKGCIALDDDIYLEGRSWDLANLKGVTFDGRGHTIDGIDQPLFSTVKGKVKNLVLTNVHISESHASKNVGAIARQTDATANIHNCAVVEGYIKNNNYAAGGLVGYCQGTTKISNCFVQADITNTGTSNTDWSVAGGLVGLVQNSNELSIEKCIALRNVSTEARSGCGGLVGGRGRKVSISQSAALQKTVATSIEYTTFVGRIFGYNDGGDYVNGEKNYAYAGMTGGANGEFRENEAVNGKDVSREDCLKADFWNDTIGWKDNESWEIEDGKLPVLMTSGLDTELQLTDGKAPVYLGGSKEQLSIPGNAKWDDTEKGKAVWDAVSNAAEYEVQLYKGSEASGPAHIVTGQTSYDFTLEIGETGFYTFKVKALGGENYVDSNEAVSGVYDFTAQSLADVETAAENTLKEMIVTNETTETEIFDAVDRIITNNSISAAWSTESGFMLK